MKKKCCTCKEVKPLDAFHNDKSRVDGKTPRCRPCAKLMVKKWYEKDPEKARKVWRKSNIARGRNYKLLKNYGISEVKYNELFKEQEGRCAICTIKAEDSKGRNPGRLVVDHCHVSGAVRGLLCGKCNTVLGLVEDDPVRCLNAASYLKKNSSQRKE